MKLRAFSKLRLTACTIPTLLPVAALGHSGHGAPSVHAHAGSPSMLAVLGIVTLGVAALVPLARFLRRHYRLRHPTGRQR